MNRTSWQEVYNQIVADLSEAKSLLNDDYPALEDDFVTPARVRANKASATALLARVYLFLEQWNLAEQNASAIIDDPRYQLTDDLSSVFLANSTESIFQLKPVEPGYNTFEGFCFIVTGSPQYNVVTQSLLNSFEDGDARLDSWIGMFDTGSEVVYYPHKYKIKQNDPSAPVTEYSTVLRVAEQYLIRAEARAELDNASGAISDLDMLRKRAELPLIQVTNPGIDNQTLLATIQHERQVELFAEWGHRWLDLKRTGSVDAVLGAVKSDWTSTDALYPIPQLEMRKNPKLHPQNDGY